jgi:hypothetical protein
MTLIQIEPDWPGHFHRHGLHFHIDAERMQRAQKFRIEFGNRTEQETDSPAVPAVEPTVAVLPHLMEPNAW